MADVQLTQSEKVQYVVNDTATDKHGVERILGPALDNWQAAPVEATAAQKKAAKERAKKWELVSEARQAQQQTGTATNVQYDGGSQTVPPAAG